MIVQAGGGRWTGMELLLFARCEEDAITGSCEYASTTSASSTFMLPTTAHPPPNTSTPLPYSFQWSPHPLSLYLYCYFRHVLPR